MLNTSRIFVFLTGTIGNVVIIFLLQDITGFRSLTSNDILKERTLYILYKGPAGRILFLRLSSVSNIDFSQTYFSFGTEYKLSALWTFSLFRSPESEYNCERWENKDFVENSERLWRTPAKITNIFLEHRQNIYFCLCFYILGFVIDFWASLSSHLSLRTAWKGKKDFLCTISASAWMIFGTKNDKRKWHFLLLYFPSFFSLQNVDKSST